MKKNIQSFAVAVVLILCPQSYITAQSLFTAKEYVDINNIRASTLLHGDLWSDEHMETACEFPKNSGKHLSTNSGLWLSGHDAASDLHLSASLYRYTVADFWPGPLDGSSILDIPRSEKWARIWKVNKTDIDAFKALTTHDVTNTPQAILEWPAKNNPYAKGANNQQLTITTDMAPFVDVNVDGIYDPLTGDYPEINGDQALWWIFCDDGPTRNVITGIPLHVEVHAMAYAFKRGTIADNIVFYQFDIKNKSSYQYDDFRFALRCDGEIGYPYDDYIGFDATRRMGITYNGAAVDGSGQPNSYGTGAPVMGVTMLEIPGDNGAIYEPLGSFMSFTNSNDPIFGDPKDPVAIENFMQAKWQNGDPLTYSGLGHNSGLPTSYIFPSSPKDAGGWSECIEGIPPGDRRFVISTKAHQLLPGSSRRYTFALVAAMPNMTVSGGCPYVNFDEIRIVADTARKIFSGLTPTNIANTKIATALKIYPNPANKVLHIETGETSTSKQIKTEVYDAVGRIMNVSTTEVNGKITVDIHNLNQGMYYIRHSNDKETITTSFIKQF